MTTRSSLRNPIAQERFAERIRRAGGKGLVEVSVVTGKKAFVLKEIEWAVLSPDSLEVLTTPPSPDDDRRLWLACNQHTAYFNKGARVEMKHALVFAVSAHAMIQLAMRRNARTVDDLLSVMNELWLAVRPKLQEPIEMKPWSAKVTGGTALLHWLEDLRTYVVVTVLGEKMIAP